MKKLLVLLLTLTLSLGAFSLVGCNEPENPDNPETPAVEVEGTEGLTYMLLGEGDNKYAAFTGVSGNCTEKDIVIASHYQGYKVTEIGSLLGQLSGNGMKNVETIKVHKYITLIASSAFTKAENLKTITFDKECELISIGSSAFKNLKKLENFNYYGNLNSVGESVFDGCDSLKTTDYVGAKYIGSDTNPYLILYKGLNEETVKVHKDCQAIFAKAFYSQGNIKTVTFEKDDVLKSIGTEAFSTSYVADPINDDSLQEKAEVPAPQITEISIPKSVTAMGDRVFKCNETLKTVTFAENNSLNKIGIELFQFCRDLEEIKNFEHTNITVIEDNMCRGNRKLKYFVIPNTVVTIKADVLWNCNSVASLTFEDNSVCEEIQMQAFRGCLLLQQVVIPASVQKIDYDVFSYCGGRQTSNFTIYSESTGPNSTYHQNWRRFKTNIKLDVDPTNVHKAYFKGEWQYVNGKPTPIA